MSICLDFQPDHNGECLHCDDLHDAHSCTLRAASILCLLCGAESWNPGDIAERYCGRCHLFHALVGLARRLHATGSPHDCPDWRTARGACAVCGQAIP